MLALQGAYMRNKGMAMNGETKQKRNHTASLRLPEALFLAMEEQRKFHGTPEKKLDKTAYFRGLLYLDVALSGHGTDGLGSEGWLSLAYGELLRAAPEGPTKRFSFKPEIVIAAPDRKKDAKFIKQIMEDKQHEHADRGSTRRTGRRKAVGS